MAEDARSPEPEPVERDEQDTKAREAPPEKAPEKTWEDILEEDRFESTDN